MTAAVMTTYKELDERIAKLVEKRTNKWTTKTIMLVR